MQFSHVICCTAAAKYCSWTSVERVRTRQVFPTVNWCSLLLCSSWVLAPKLSPCINARNWAGPGKEATTTGVLQSLGRPESTRPIPSHLTSPLPLFPHLVVFVTFLAYLSGLGKQFGQRITHYSSEEGHDSTRKLTSQVLF